jgi:DNA invertase Pin-like site-specific DNA recombinase
MTSHERRVLRCAIYTRKSSEHGLEQDFNSLDAQREAGEAYIKSQAQEGWRLVKTAYDDGGLSGGTRFAARVRPSKTRSFVPDPSAW